MGSQIYKAQQLLEACQDRAGKELDPGGAGFLKQNPKIRLYREPFQFAKCFTGICPLTPISSQILTLAGKNTGIIDRPKIHSLQYVQKALEADRFLQDACQFQICRKLEKDLGWRIRGRAEESGDYVSY
jgi:hypothetical protein